LPNYFKSVKAESSERNMADDELKRLLEGLFSDIPTKVAPREAPPEIVSEQHDVHESEKLAARFQAAARLSRAASSILELDELLPQVVDLIREEFGFYYVGIFLVDEDREWAVLQAGTGEAGRRMLEQGHRLRVGKASMIGWCVANAQARIALDVGEEAVRFDNPLLPQTRSEMALPLVSRGRASGAMTIQSTEPIAFTQQDITVLQTMADQLANAIENARLFQGSERRLTELAIVSEIGQALASALALDELLEMVHQQVSRLFDANNFYIATYEEGSDEWTSAFHLEGGQRQPPARYKVEAGLTGYIIRNLQHLLFRSVEENVAFNEAQGTTVIGEMARSWLGVPLIAADRLVGVMAIQDYEQEGLYDERDLTLFSTVAAQVAVALDNLWLLEETRRRAQQLEVINEVGRAVTSVLDLDTVLRQVVDITKARFGHYFVAVALVDGDQVVYQDGSTIGDSGTRLRSGQLVADLKGGPSLIAEAVRTGRPVLANDVLSDPRYLAVPELPDTRSELSVPLEVKGRVIGVLDVQSDRPGAYDHTDMALLQSLASQAGVAIDNAHLFEQTQRRLRVLTMLSNVSQAMASAPLQAEEIIDIIARQFVEVMDVQEASISLLDPQERTLRTVADLYVGEEGERIRDEQIGKTYPLADHPATLRVMETLEPLVIQASDPDADPAELAYMREAETATLAIIPLAVKGRAIGVIELEESQDAHDYTPEELNLAMTLANQAAVALENARLFGETESRAEEQAILRRITEAVSRSLEVQDLLESALSETLAGIHFDAGLVSLRDEDSDRLYLAAQQGLPEPMTRKLEREGLADTLCHFVFQQGETLYLSDVRQGAPVDVSGLIEQGLFTYVGTPLVYKGENAGTICLFNRSVRDVTSRDLGLLEAIGRQLAVGVGNVRLLEQTRAALAEVETTHRSYLRRGWQEHLRQREMLERSGFLYDRTRARRPEDMITERDLWRPEMARALMAGEPATAQDGGEDGGRTGLAVPISLRGQSFGVLGVESPGGDRRWTEDELALIEAVGDQLAQTLESARLFGETTRRAEQMSTLHAIGLDLSTGLELDRVLEILYEQCKQVFAAGTFYVALYDEATALIEFPLMTGATGPIQIEPVDIRRQPGITGYVIQSGQMLYVPDVDAVPEDAPYHAIPESEPYARSYVGVPLSARGKVIGVLSIQSYEPNAYTDEDVTLLTTIATQASIAIENARAYERLVETAEELRELDRLKTQFLANMSHELRTPLNSIIGFSRVMIKGIDGPLTDLQEADLTSIYNSGQHLLSLINSILDMSKIEAGKMDLAFDEVFLPDILGAVVSTTSALMKDRPITLRSEVPHDLPSVWADVQRVRQVLINLMSNAVKYTEKGHITLQAEAGPEVVTISVIDTGIGIDQEAQSRLFIPFQQVDASTTRRAGGTGLGLAISHSFVQMHGGEIWVESEPGQGSTFSFTLPLYQIVQERAEEDSELSLAPDEKVVLAIDDDAGVITLLKRYLEHEGYQVVGVMQSHQALETAQRLASNLIAITLDVVMPHMDGWQVLRALKDDPETKDIPVILCSIVEGLEQGLGLGAAACLRKPVTRDEVLDALRKVEQQGAGVR
jgi:GAF domain-containing protein/ActR/RegA family two-component response regulator